MRKIKLWIHKILGSIYCKLMLIICNIRDFRKKQNTDALLIVAHPDDEVLFFHKYLQNHKPYVLVLSGGDSWFRTKSFMKVMKIYGLNGRIYDMGTDDLNSDLIKKRIKRTRSLGEFRTIATHNSDGEYGHKLHQCVHSAVVDLCGDDVLVPVARNEIEHYPIPNEDYDFKVNVFKTVYTSELFVLDLWQDYLKNEKLI